MITADFLVSDAHQAYVRTRKGLFLFTGDRIREELSYFLKFHYNKIYDKYPLSVEIARIGGVNGTFSVPRMPQSVVIAQPNLDKGLRLRLNQANAATKKGNVCLVCWTPNGYVAIQNVCSLEQVQQFIGFRARLALAVDDSNHYAVARAWLNGQVLHDGGLESRVSCLVAKKARGNSIRSRSPLILDRDTGRNCPKISMALVALALRKYIGLGRIVYELKKQRQPSGVWWVFAHYALPNAAVRRVVHGCWAVGRDHSLKLATTKAIAEAVERFGSGYYKDELLVSGSFIELKRQAIDPRDLLCYSQKQYESCKKIRPFERSRKYKWVNGYRLNGTRPLVLADLVFYPFAHGKAPYSYANSSGVAAHVNRLKAENNALLEVVERDAIMRVWHHRIVLPVLPRTILLPLAARVLNRLTNDNYSVQLHWVTFATVPTVLVSCHTKSSNQWPNFVIACAAHPSLKHACQKALLEAEASLYTFGRRPKKRITKLEVRHVEDHGLFAADPSNRKIYGDFFRQDNGMATYTDILENSAIEKLRKQAIFVGLATGVRGALKVVRAFVPGLVPMTFGVGMEPLGMHGMKVPPEGCVLDQEALDKYADMPHPMA